MVTCPRCHYHFVPRQDVRSEDSFELFHVIRDAYCRATGYSSVYAKNELCILHGVAVEYHEPFTPPPWPGVFVEIWNKIYFRKSTTQYSKDEMARLIEGATSAVIEAGGEVPLRSEA